MTKVMRRQLFFKAVMCSTEGSSIHTKLDVERFRCPSTLHLRMKGLAALYSLHRVRMLRKLEGIDRMAYALWTPHRMAYDVLV